MGALHEGGAQRRSRAQPRVPRDAMAPPGCHCHVTAEAATTPPAALLLRALRRDFRGIYQECAQVLYEEIDYINEGKNADRFRRNFADIPWVRGMAFADIGTRRVNRGSTRSAWLQAQRAPLHSRPARGRHSCLFAARRLPPTCVNSCVDSPTQLVWTHPHNAGGARRSRCPLCTGSAPARASSRSSTCPAPRSRPRTRCLHRASTWTSSRGGGAGARCPACARPARCTLHPAVRMCMLHRRTWCNSAQLPAPPAAERPRRASSISISAASISSLSISAAERPRRTSSRS